MAHLSSHNCQILEDTEFTPSSALGPGFCSRSIQGLDSVSGMPAGIVAVVLCVLSYEGDSKLETGGT